MKNSSVSKSIKPIAYIFRRYNVTVFIVTMVGGLVFAVYALSSILTTPATGPDGSSPHSRNSFDTETVNRLNDLHPSGENTTGQTPTSGRVNPFSE